MMKDTARSIDGVGAAKHRFDADALAEALAELHQLDASGLQRRWRSLVGGLLPQDLGRPLILHMLAYALQAQRLGDLDKASQRELSAAHIRSMGTGGTEDNPQSQVMPSCGGSAEHVSRKAGHGNSAPRFARPGMILTREHGGIIHRVTVLDEWVSWNGKTYESLSKVAFAITGTRWNGPRFFGLRDKAKQGSDGGRKPQAQPTAAINGRGRARSNRWQRGAST